VRPGGVGGRAAGVGVHVCPVLVLGQQRLHANAVPVPKIRADRERTSA
jgi:hypothetical protein